MLLLSWGSRCLNDTSACLLLGVSSCLLNDPVVLLIVFDALLTGKVPEDFSEDLIVRFFVEAKLTTVIEVLSELIWKSSRQLFNSSGHLLLEDQLILVLFVHLGMCLQPLPWQLSLEEVY